jgi:hypothetical protein
MKKLVNIFSFLVILSTTSCDIIDDPFQDVGPIDTSGTGDTIEYKRKALLEDYTGHTCVNCPEATEEAFNLKENIYGDQLIIMAVHVGSFADPVGPLYLYDFRTTAGNELNAVFGVTAFPNGLVNRKEVSGSKIIPFGSWGTVAGDILALPPDAGMKIKNSYNATTRNMTIEVDVKYWNELTGNYSIALYLTEDSIIKPQKDDRLAPPYNDTNYVHMHALRGAINTTWGESLSTGTMAAGSTFTKNFLFHLDPAWNEQHCNVVAIIYDEATDEIIQAEEEHVLD